jgi:hypothetical protein
MTKMLTEPRRFTDRQLAALSLAERALARDDNDISEAAFNIISELTDGEPFVPFDIAEKMLAESYNGEI